MQRNSTYPQRLYAIAKKDNASKGSLYLDMSEREHYLCALEMFGGKEPLQDEFPIHWKAISNARKRIPAPLGDAEKDFDDFATVENAHFDKTKGELYARGQTHLAQKATALSQTLLIFRNGSLLGQQAASSFGASSAAIEGTAHLEEIKQNDELAFIMHTSWHPHDAYTFTSMVSYDIHKVKERPLDEAVSKIEVIAPRHRFSPHDSDITLAYGRKAEEREIIDYTYKKVRLEARQKVFLENSGVVTLREGYEFIEGDPENTSIALSHEAMGTVHYCTKITQSAFHKTSSNTFEWSFDPDWDATIPTGAIGDGNVYDFDMTLSFLAQYKGGRPTRYSVNISSSPGTENPHFCQIPKLRILSGCLASGSLVLMADGSEKPIEEIRTNDMVMGIYRFPLRVTNVYSGDEEEIFVLRTDTGKEILATSNHPLLTDEGMVPVNALRIMDRLEMEDGWLASLAQCFPVRYFGKVHNLDIEGGQPFICNDFVVGDFTTQNSSRINPRKRLVVPKALAIETERLVSLVS